MSEIIFIDKLLGSIIHICKSISNPYFDGQIKDQVAGNWNSAGRTISA